MCVRHLYSTALVLAAISSTAACDKASPPSEATAQEVSSRQVPADALSAAGANPIHFSTNGPFAHLQAGALLGDVYREGHLELAPSGDDQAYVYYAAFECDLTTFSCATVEQASGFISGGELTTSHGRITVKTNSAGNPSFELLDGSGGPIEITWTELSGWSYRASTQLHNRSPGYSSHSHGTYTASSALVEGSFIGIPIEPGNAYAEMGTVKDGGVTITRDE